MMKFPVYFDGCEVGSCSVLDQGLYWMIDCACSFRSDHVERLYCGSNRLAVLEQSGDQLVCRRRLSKRSNPEIPPGNGYFSLRPVKPYEPWDGELLGKKYRGFRTEDTLLFPYHADQPCPCEPLICFFSVKDGFWQLPLREEWTKNEPVGV